MGAGGLTSRTAIMNAALRMRGCALQPVRRRSIYAGPAGERFSCVRFLR